MDLNDAVLPSSDQPVNLNYAILPSSDHPVDLRLRVLASSDRIQIEELANLFLIYHIHSQIARILSMTSMPKWRRMKRTHRLKSKRRRMKTTHIMMSHAEKNILGILLATAFRVNRGEHLDDALQKACRKNFSSQAQLAEILDAYNNYKSLM